MIASTALARAEHFEQMLAVALKVAGLDSTTVETTASYADPASARVQARKRRIEVSGFQLIAGGAS